MQKNGDSKKEQWLPRIRAQGEMNRWNTQDMGVVKLFCMILQWWIQLPKPIECSTLRMNPNVNSDLWVIILSFIDCKKHTTWCRMSTIGEVIGVWGQRVYGNSGLSTINIK